MMVPMAPTVPAALAISEAKDTALNQALKAFTDALNAKAPLASLLPLITVIDEQTKQEKNINLDDPEQITLFKAALTDVGRNSLASFAAHLLRNVSAKADFSGLLLLRQIITPQQLLEKLGVQHADPINFGCLPVSSCLELAEVFSTSQFGRYDWVTRLLTPVRGEPSSPHYGRVNELLGMSYLNRYAQDQLPKNLQSAIAHLQRAIQYGNNVIRELLACQYCLVWHGKNLINAITFDEANKMLEEDKLKGVEAREIPPGVDLMTEPYERVLKTTQVISNLLLARLSLYVHDEDERMKLERDSNDKIDAELAKINALHDQYQLPQALKAQYQQCVLAYRQKQLNELERHFINLITREQKCLLSYSDIKKEFQRRTAVLEFDLVCAKHQSLTNQLRDEFIQRVVQWIMYGIDADVTQLKELLKECHFRLGEENTSPDLFRKEIYAIMLHEIQTCIAAGIPYRARTVHSPRLKLYCECHPSPRLHDAIIPHGQEFHFLLGETPADAYTYPEALYLAAKNSEQSARAEMIWARRLLCRKLIGDAEVSDCAHSLYHSLGWCDLDTVKRLYRLYDPTDKKYERDLPAARENLRKGEYDYNIKRDYHVFDSLNQARFLLDDAIPFPWEKVIFNLTQSAETSDHFISIHKKDLNKIIFGRGTFYHDFIESIKVPEREFDIPIELRLSSCRLTEFQLFVGIQATLQDCTLTRCRLRGKTLRTFTNCTLSNVDLTTGVVVKMQDCTLSHVVFNEGIDVQLQNCSITHLKYVGTRAMGLCVGSPIVKLLKGCDGNTLRQSVAHLMQVYLVGISQGENLLEGRMTASYCPEQELFRFTDEFFKAIFATPHAAVLIDPLITVLNDILESKTTTYRFLQQQNSLSKLFGPTSEWSEFINKFAFALFKAVQAAQMNGDIKTSHDAHNARLMLERAQQEGHLKTGYVAQLDQLVGPPQPVVPLLPPPT
jgi:hypothetical protein